MSLQCREIERQMQILQSSLRSIIHEIDATEDDIGGAIETARNMRLERDRLRAELAEAQVSAADYQRMWALANHQLAEARKDTERLDWLEQYRFVDGDAEELVTEWQWKGKRYPAGLRAAIDAAISTGDGGSKCQPLE